MEKVEKGDSVTSQKFRLVVNRLNGMTNSPGYHANPSCYSWVNMSRPNSKPPAGFVIVIIAMTPHIPFITYSEATADRREGIALINNLSHPLEDGEKEQAIIELEKIFSNSGNP